MALAAPAAVLGTPGAAAATPAGGRPGAGDAAGTLRVAADGSGDFRTVQAAVDAVPSGNTEPVTVSIAPGTYREHVEVPAGKPYITFAGTGGSREDTVIVYDTPSGEEKPGGGTQGSTGSATVLIDADDFSAHSLAFVNDFDEAAHPGIDGPQALAVKTTGDRIRFDDTAFKGNQDTLMTNSPALEEISRVYISDSFIEGDVDFVYGRATTVIEDSLIRALDRGSDSNNGYITAASTWKDNPYGFLITDCRIVSDAPDGTYHLGRPWHPSGDPDAVGQVLVRDTELPAAIKDSPWTDMSGFPWEEARFAEYENHGPGATVTPGRPQMSDAEAAEHETGDYLAGSDGWAPHRS
ncbi:hypothetical protein CRI70_09215 [Streptomyces sp. Ru87]|nr:hypothetical protein CRI70_09215 [Streptomyces sp. Ru87]